MPSVSGTRICTISEISGPRIQNLKSPKSCSFWGHKLPGNVYFWGHKLSKGSPLFWRYKLPNGALSWAINCQNGDRYFMDLGATRSFSIVTPSQKLGESSPSPPTPPCSLPSPARPFFPPPCLLKKMPSTKFLLDDHNK
jgi:hypothetical protein